MEANKETDDLVEFPDEFNSTDNNNSDNVRIVLLMHMKINLTSLFYI